MSHPDDDDTDDVRWEWPHPGDMGTILLAGVFLAAMIAVVIFMLSSPTPVSDLFAKKAPAHEQSVVDVSVPPKQ